ncbi:SseB family protein [Compostimonas suwonensis]|uniref:Type III secretion system (T3SS) SseB-like protein n=1 Tax=Compostimonas suwonensis TaxID=1048394 RepID=A0A2M9BTQ8_9MICO|nr:SseB family protein [Compostimonas suwonensis]PJJ61323.1 type III secretion system (T3SS) SseB-like protein [Compostimonas suwonensis]
MSRLTDQPADSAGQPWAGRHFDANVFSGDDGSAPERLIEALRRFRSREVGEGDVVDALRDARLLIPLVAHAGETGVDEHGRTVDRTQELSIVTVAGPDGRSVLPVFTSVEAMGAWNPSARPVPADGVRVALAAASEKTDLVVVDATSPTEFVVRRPALWAIAQGESWQPSHIDPVVREAFESSIASELAVRGVGLVAGDPDARLTGPELVVRLQLVAGLTKAELDVVTSRLAQRWSALDAIATRVDSLRVQLVADA